MKESSKGLGGFTPQLENQRPSSVIQKRIKKPFLYQIIRMYSKEIRFQNSIKNLKIIGDKIQ